MGNLVFCGMYAAKEQKSKKVGSSGLPFLFFGWFLQWRFNKVFEYAIIGWEWAGGQVA